MKPDPRLNVQERNTPLWLRLRAHMAEKLEKLREQNDGFGLNEIQTAQVRGQIKCLRDLIALEEPPPFQDDGNTNQHTATRAGLE
jgi:hypothetical protein